MRNELVVVSGVALALGLAVGTAGAQQCGFPQPSKAKDIRLSLVPAFISCAGACNLCGQDASQTPDTETGVHVPGCSSPKTFNEEGGSPSDGWLWGPKSEGSIRFTAARSKILDPLFPLNTADVRISVKLSDVHDGFGLAGTTTSPSNGSLVPVSRGTSLTRINGIMTVVDAPVSFPVAVINGRANVKTSANVALGTIVGATLPGCTVLELLHLEIDDPNLNAFARPGLFLPGLPTSTPGAVTPTPTPTPTSTAPTPTATPRSRCCQKPISGTFDGCADLKFPTEPDPSAVCAGAYKGTLGVQGTSCDSDSGICEDPPSGGISNCCQFLNAGQQRCLDGPDWGTSTTNCVDQFNGTPFDNQRCQLDPMTGDGTCGP